MMTTTIPLKDWKKVIGKAFYVKRVTLFYMMINRFVMPAWVYRYSTISISIDCFR